MRNDHISVVDDYALASVPSRIVAALIDLVVYAIAEGILSTVLGIIGLRWLGSLVAASYLLFRDSLPFLKYQSVGKKLIRLRVVQEHNYRISPGTDLKRNFIFLPTFLNTLGISFIYIGGAVTMLLILIELYQLYTNEDGQRLGDSFADTLVIETNKDLYDR